MAALDAVYNEDTRRMARELERLAGIVSRYLDPLWARLGLLAMNAEDLSAMVDATDASLRTAVTVLWARDVVVAAATAEGGSRGLSLVQGAYIIGSDAFHGFLAATTDAEAAYYGE